MNVTGVPAQIVEPGFAAITTDVAMVGFTVIVMELLDADEAVTHVSEENISHEITSPFDRVEELNVALPEATIVPFTLHW